jgi:hypothetical protein
MQNTLLKPQRLARVAQAPPNAEFALVGDEFYRLLPTSKCFFCGSSKEFINHSLKIITFYQPQDCCIERVVWSLAFREESLKATADERREIPSLVLNLRKMLQNEPSERLDQARAKVRVRMNQYFGSDFKLRLDSLSRVGSYSVHEG